MGTHLGVHMCRGLSASLAVKVEKLPNLKIIIHSKCSDNLVSNTLLNFEWRNNLLLLRAVILHGGDHFTTLVRDKDSWTFMME